MKFIKVFSILLSTTMLAYGKNMDSVQKFAYHFQQTLVGQSAFADTLSTIQKGSHNAFYDPTMKMSMSATFHLGFKLWKYGSFYINPDVAGGSGLGGTLGIAGYVNGEVFRVGNPAPTVYFSRMFIRQYFPIKKDCSYIIQDAN